MPTSTGNISFGGKNLSDAEAAAVAARFEKAKQEQAEQQAQLPAIRLRGQDALHRLMKIAQGSSGQCRHVAAFLLGLYNGTRFKFDLTDLRCVDRAIFDDCLAVLQMDYQPAREVHQYFPDGNKLFEDLANDWGVPDRLKLRDLIEQSNLTGGQHHDELRDYRADYLRGRNA